MHLLHCHANPVFQKGMEVFPHIMKHGSDLSGKIYMVDLKEVLFSGTILLREYSIPSFTPEAFYIIWSSLPTIVPYGNVIWPTETLPDPETNEVNCILNSDWVWTTYMQWIFINLNLRSIPCFIGIVWSQSSHKAIYRQCSSVWGKKKRRYPFPVATLQNPSSVVSYRKIIKSVVKLRSTIGWNVLWETEEGGDWDCRA